MSGLGYMMQFVIFDVDIKLTFLLMITMFYMYCNK